MASRVTFNDDPGSPLHFLSSRAQIGSFWAVLVVLVAIVVDAESSPVVATATIVLAIVDSFDQNETRIT